MSYPNEIFSAFAFVGFAISFIPLPWHLQAWNTGTCLYMVWTGLACLNQFINSVVWKGTIENFSPTWCDISTRFMVGSAVAIPAASLCINRRLYHIATCQAVTVTKAERRRAVMVDLFIGLGIPFAQMALQYIVQGHRFDIFENIGCFPFTYNVWPAYILVVSWPLIIGCISAIYCVLSIRAFRQRQAAFNELISANVNLTYNRYFRLMSLAGIEVACTIPLSIWSIYVNANAGLSPYLGWADTHWGFSAVHQIPAAFWTSSRNAVIGFESSRWLVVACAFIFFGFFGFADEARKHYKIAYVSFARKVGYSSLGSSNTSSSVSKPNMTSSCSNSIPVFVRRDIQSKRDSYAKSIDGLSVSDLTGAIHIGPYSPTSSGGSSSRSSLPFDEKVAEIEIPEPALDMSALDRIPSIHGEHNV